MTHKEKIKAALVKSPMTSREISKKLRMDSHLTRVTINEMQGDVIPCGHKREGKRGPKAYIWKLAA